ncbi:Shedu anti-phage system protein SduA domain-containing protein [Rhodococcus sp. BS-15]|uniref:Shedu anti-phage system protein SduA domain-containing protein n=1 Tax=Rhodococcus sp. BS-15 TaxID=1304954 RepID=UPI000FFC3C79|nr:Shedu anti-phage system protein SduA domain-containing protein [Rhodococcus sp. BS-15]
MSDYDDMSRAELDEIGAHLASETARVKRERRAIPDLEPHLVEWDTITPELVDEFQQILDHATTERDTQQFLQEHRQLLLQPLRGGHGRWVLPQKAFGGHFRSDFMIAELSSSGFEWTAVELEGPQRPLFTKTGQPAQYLRKGISQIEEWRLYIKENLDACRKPRAEMGQGLADIDDQVRGWVIIGRRDPADEKFKRQRRQLATRHNVEIRTYDWLIDRARERVDELARARSAD